MSPNPRDRTRAAVLDATLELLGERGYAGVNIDAIARRSGVARSTIYRHWPTVAAVVFDAVSATVAPTAVPDTGDAWRDLRAHLGSLAAKLTASRWGELLPVLVDAAGRDADLWELQRADTAERRAAAMAIVERGRQAGQVRLDVDVDLVGEMLVGAVFTRHLVTHRPIDDEFLDGLLVLVRSMAAT